MPRIWVEFTDPANDAQRFRCDLTWLTSSWTCIFGAGCQGIYADRPDDGCCTLGAHFTDADDVERVRAAATVLGEDEWQHRPGGRGVDADGRLKTSAWTEKEDSVRKTRVVDGACIFLNRPGFAGGAGCALHLGAEAHGEPAHDWKPNVCWQLPLRIENRTDPDGTAVTVLRRWRREDFGTDGEDMAWFCTEGPDAFVGDRPVVESLADELAELVGAAAADAITRAVLRTDPDDPSVG